MKWLKPSLTWGFVFAGLFGLISLIFDFGDWSGLAFRFSLGFFIGLLGAPEAEPKAFKYPSLFQVICGAIAGSIVGIMFSLSTVEIILASTTGGFLGWTASYWLKHLPASI
ncbi:MAG: hypothetical protein ACQ9MH_07430 [Nitrospinales bacterium]